MSRFTCIKKILCEDTPMKKGKVIWTESDVTSLREALSPLKENVISFYDTEMFLMEKIVYKNRNQHRNAVFFQRVRKVRY